jgi:NTP pyrophosphatase (non-canonical NTP hydrolase)
MTTKLSGFQRYIGTWGQDTFPESTLSGQMAHLDLEICEVQEAATNYFNNPTLDNKKEFQAEIADVFILILGIAHRMDFDLMLVAADKFRVIQSRKWLPANPDGVYHHIAEDIVA